MERKKVVVALAIVLIYVFAIGTVTAFSPQPGSADDPLVTKSYVDLVFGPLQNRVTQLEQDLLGRTAEVEALKAELEKSKTTIKDLEGKVAVLQNQPPVAPVAPVDPVVPVVPTPPPATVYGYINGSWVNIRSGPGTNFSVIVVLPNNTRVELLERGAQWHKIKHNDRIAYVSAPLLRIP
jgi:hypothetical protein